MTVFYRVLFFFCGLAAMIFGFLVAALCTVLAAHHFKWNWVFDHPEFVFAVGALLGSLPSMWGVHSIGLRLKCDLGLREREPQGFSIERSSCPNQDRSNVAEIDRKVPAPQEESSNRTMHPKGPDA